MRNTLALAELPPITVFQRLASSPKGLTEADAAARLAEAGVPAAAAAASWPRLLLTACASPFVGLLLVLDLVLFAVGDPRGPVTVTTMIVLSVALRLWQEVRSQRAMASVRGLVTTTARVRRRADLGAAPRDREIPTADLVRGDLVLLEPGDRVPADLRLLSARDLVVDQAALSGETVPARKAVPSCTSESTKDHRDPLDNGGLCLAGTMVLSGVATAIVLGTGRDTHFGALTERLSGRRAESSFDAGVRAVGWTLVRFMAVLAPIVLVVNGLVTEDWAQACLFAVSVAVGLTPEMLPVILAANLARGVTALARRRVVVKRVNAVQDLGAMDVLCVDKTGTITQDRVQLAEGVDAAGAADDDVLDYAYLACHFQALPHDQLHEAVLDELDEADRVVLDSRFSPVDELTFDHARRISTVVVSPDRGDTHLVITTGDPDEVLDRCTEALGAVFDAAARHEAAEVVKAHHRHGRRVLAIAAKQVPARLDGYRENDEYGLALLGFVSFLDPPKESACAAIRRLAAHGVTVKVLTGDNPEVATRTCRAVGLEPGTPVLGADLDRLDNDDLRALARHTTVFAKTTPVQKARIVAVLRGDGHAVGFLGDGVNDIGALRAADVGIAVDSGVDLAKDAADLVLLERDLTVLADGVVEGRRTLGNTMKYVKVTASSNFGNVLSVLFASAFLPFLPILPAQLLVQNLLYDTAQLALPWDRVDAEYLRRPRRWDAAGLVRFMLVFGPLSSLFDLATFAALWWGLGANSEAGQGLFQTGWLVEGLLSQLLVVLVLRTRAVPVLRGRPSTVVWIALATVAAVGVALPVSPLAAPLGLEQLPSGYFPWLVTILFGYFLAAQLTKTWYLRRVRAWL
ncbi:magnesium-translocating P-type ATPase [Amycolatopsis sp. H20-H5]|uniref:magnesium-translocating P-type ATPase n=1 Tax=Amycolatopsis sp. H20-H5 TaxID=3046309 RepID=UPI002DBAD0EE|nr:magnesium-translocating P-type ATPase [Amycolatopsis sp. H20-H5]MEC3980484.1 magnesium-translocating P-type ATPase [Amycolatopsis sp. H20-H5]